MCGQWLIRARRRDGRVGRPRGGERREKPQRGGTIGVCRRQQAWRIGHSVDATGDVGHHVGRCRQHGGGRRRRRLIPIGNAECLRDGTRQLRAVLDMEAGAKVCQCRGSACRGARRQAELRLGIRAPKRLQMSLDDGQQRMHLSDIKRYHVAVIQSARLSLPAHPACPPTTALHLG